MSREINPPLSFTIGSSEKTFADHRYPFVLLSIEICEILQPCFEVIRQRTGKLIDPYGAVIFSGTELEVLKEEFTAKKRLIDAALSPLQLDFGWKKCEVPAWSVSHVLQRSLDLIEIALIDGKVFICDGQ